MLEMRRAALAVVLSVFLPGSAFAASPAPIKAENGMVVTAQHLASRIGLSHIKVYVAAQNVITWTRYSGYDPEVSRNGQNTLTQGIDYSVYPNNKSYQAGLSISF